MERSHSLLGTHRAFRALPRRPGQPSVLPTSDSPIFGPFLAASSSEPMIFALSDKYAIPSTPHSDLMSDLPVIISGLQPNNATFADVVFHVGLHELHPYTPPHFVSGWATMGETRENGDLALVRACLSGSEQAWDELYCRYVALVKSMVRRHVHRPAAWELEDITQSVFAALIPALRRYDAAYSLSRFVCVIAERVCIQEYRRSKTAKRAGQSESVDRHDGDEGGTSLRSGDSSQEELLSQHQAQDLLRRTLKQLDSPCRELLRLRYIEELPYKEISKMLGASENTLTVRARRCLNELSSAYAHELIRRSDSP